MNVDCSDDDDRGGASDAIFASDESPIREGARHDGVVQFCNLRAGAEGARGCRAQSRYELSDGWVTSGSPQTRAFGPRGVSRSTLGSIYPRFGACSHAYMFSGREHAFCIHMLSAEDLFLFHSRFALS